MLGCYDFCGHYEWTFEWLRQQGGEPLVCEYWDVAIARDSQLHAAALIGAKGIAGMKEYWGHTLDHEAAGYAIISTDNVFRIDMHVCPSKGFLIRNGLAQYRDYCDHCMGWVGPVMKEAGFVVDHEHNHYGQCWWEMHRKDDSTPPSEIGALSGEQDVRLCAGWETTEAMDVFRRAAGPADKTTTNRAWEKLPPMPEPNGGFACGVENGGITVLGGTNWKNGEKQWLKTISHFDSKKMRWEIVGNLSEPVAYASYGTWRHGDDSREILIMLGGSNGKRPVKALAIVDTARTVLQPAPMLPEQVALCTSGIVGNAFIMVGGTADAADLAGLTNRAFSFDLVGRMTTPLPDYPGRPFALAASVVLGDELFVFGGANWNESDKTVANSAESYAFSVGKKRWRQLKPYPVASRGTAAVALDEHRIYLAGGYGGEPETFLATAFIYDTRTDSYAEATPLRYGALVGLVKLDGFVYCLGGEDRQRHREDVVWRVRVDELLK